MSTRAATTVDDPGNPSRGGDPDVAVRVTDVRKKYGQREILTGVSFQVHRGELFSLLGPNGAGKTTTVEIVEGYRRADGGSVEVLGRDPARDGTRLRPRIGLMLQEGGIDNRTTPRRGAAPVRALLPRPGGPGPAARDGRPS